MTAPKYRSDIAGKVKESIADFEEGIRNEYQHSDNFIFDVEDSENYQQWKDYLTLAEMKAAFKRAQKVKGDPMKNPTAAQLAARKLFASRAKAGTLRKNPTKRKTAMASARKTAKRRGPSKVNAPSQLTGRKPTTRLKARRRANTKPRMYPNPLSKLPFQVQVFNQRDWATIAAFDAKLRAEQYAKAINALGTYTAVRVWKD